MFLPQAFNITSSLSVMGLQNIIGVIKLKNMIGKARNIYG
jgi:hypothetical protein